MSVLPRDGSSDCLHHLLDALVSSDFLQEDVGCSDEDLLADEAEEGSCGEGGEKEEKED